MTETLAYGHSSERTSGFQKYLCPYALDESSLSIRRVNNPTKTVGFNNSTIYELCYVVRLVQQDTESDFFCKK